MRATGGGPDFITIDGAEGGTGAAPLAFADHVALPLKLGFSRVYCAFAEAGIADDVVFIGSGRLGLPDTAVFAFALGCDMINVGREAMLAIGCIQAQRCHTGDCPTGVATQNRWLMRGLDPELKSRARCANYVRALRGELLALSRVDAASAIPALVTPEHVEIVGERYATARRRGHLRLRPGVARDRRRAARGDRGAARPARATTVDDAGARGGPDRRRRGRHARGRRQTSDVAEPGDVFTNPVTGERCVVRDERRGGRRALVDLYVTPGGAVAAEHIHPACASASRSSRHGRDQARRASGRSAGPAVDVDVPRAHDWWNAATTRHVLVGRRRRRSFEQMRITRVRPRPRRQGQTRRACPTRCSSRSSRRSSTT